MMVVLASLKGFAVEAADGAIGIASTFLLDDASWTMRWMVVDVGHWLPGRTVLVHPSAIDRANHRRRTMSVRLTKPAVAASLGIGPDQPVSRPVEDALPGRHGWDRRRGGEGGPGPWTALPRLVPGLAPGPVPERGVVPVVRAWPGLVVGDPLLRNGSALVDYRVQAVTGSIGQVENLLVDDETWVVRYLVVGTQGWWPGQHVLLPAVAVTEVSWANHEVRVDVTRDRVRASPPWNPMKPLDLAYQRELQGHYGWAAREVRPSGEG